MSSTMVKTEPPTTRSRGLSGSIVAAFVALLLVAFGGGFLTAWGLQSDPQGLAPDSVVQLLDDSMAAVNANDTEAMAATYAEDAVFTNDIAGTEQVGATEIAVTYADLSLRRTSEVVMDGDYATYTFEWSVDGVQYSPAVAMVQIRDGSIVHQWITGD